MMIKLKKVRSRSAIFENRINIDSIQDELSRNLYQNQLREKILSNDIADDDDVNASWSKLKQNIIYAASEALGMKRFNPNFGSKYNKTPWFCQEIKELSTKKRHVYLKYKSLRTNDVC